MASLPRSTNSILDPQHFHQANSGLGVDPLSKSGEPRSGAMNANGPQVNSNGEETYCQIRLGVLYGDHMAINALNRGSPTPHLIDTALAASGPYHLGVSHASPTSAGFSTIPVPSRSNATQNKPMFAAISGRTSGANIIWDSAVSTTFAGSSNNDSSISSNATQMKRALSKTSKCTAAGRPQKKAKGDMDPVRLL